MGIRTVILAATTVALMGCATGEQLARDQAKSVITPIVAAQFPGLPTEAITNCIIDHATVQEILALAAAAGTGSKEQAVEIVVDVAARPETATCIAENTVKDLIGGLL